MLTHMPIEAVFILLFVIAATVAIVVQRLSIPYSVALVLTGLGLGFLHVLEAPHLTKELLFNIFLPGLLFEAAFHLEFKKFWQNKLTITALALPGVVAATALTALLLTPIVDGLHFVDGFHWTHALVFGALICATDPIAVISIFKTLGVPKRLSVLLEGESLLNDGTAIVFFTLSLTLVAGGDVTAGGLTLNFVKIVGIGIVIGAGVGVMVAQVMKRINDPMIEITLTTIAAYGSFLAAEHFHASGVIATVTAGMLCGNYATLIGMSPSTRISVETFWEYVAFALNSIVFLLIGLEVNFYDLIASWKPILVAYLIVTIGRALVIYAVSGFLYKTRERIPWSWSTIMNWGGLRGGVSMVLVLSLPVSFPHRDLLIPMTFGVVLLSILIHGLSMSPLLRWLGIVRGQKQRTDYELARGKLQATRAALTQIDRMEHLHFAAPDILADLRKEYEQKVETNRSLLKEIHLQKEDLRAEEIEEARRHLLLMEREAILEAFHHGTLSQSTHEKLLSEIDTHLLQLETNERD